MFDVPSGFTGFTIDVFGGSKSDSEGDVTKVLFAITYQERINNVDFQITNGPNDWSTMMPTGEYIGLNNPKVIFSNKDSAIVQFDMESKYPSNSLANLCYRGDNAKFSIIETDEVDKPFVPNTILGAVGFTSNEYGGSTDDQGQVSRFLLNLTFASRRNEVEFNISDDPDDWAVLMGDGSYIDLINPNVLFQNRDGATIVFQMKTPYPSSAPGMLVRKKESAIYTITEIDEDHPFVPVQQIVFPSYIPVGERINLHTQVVVYPMNSTLRGIEWSLVSPGSTNASISNGWITTSSTGKVILRATIPSGLGLGSNFKQDVEVLVIDNWIKIDEQPHLDTAAIAGNINEELNVIASTILGDLTYQWYRNSVPNNESGTAISGAQSSTFKIPKGLVPGEYYYFCEVRKVNFPSVRSDVATVRVRDALASIDIYPPAASIPPGTTQQFAITRNPQTSDELAIVTWHSDNHHIITIDQKGVATSHNPGVATISAEIEGVRASIKATTIYTPVSNIKFPFENVLETGLTYELPTRVEPTNASNQKIEWEIVSAGTTGTTIENGRIIPNGVGSLTMRATVKKGATPTTDFTREYVFSVIKGHVPVTNITIDDVGQPRVGEIITLKGTVTPSNATNVSVDWVVKNDGNTGAEVSAGNIATFTGSGNCVLQAVVKNGLDKTTDFTKDFPITVRPKFISVQCIEGFPSDVQYYDGKDGIKLVAKVSPTNAEHTQIIYSIASTDESNLSPRITDGTLFFDSKSMTNETEASIIVNMIVKEGLSEGVDYVTESAIAVVPPPAPVEFVPIVRATWVLPSILRAFRPIKIDESYLTPEICTNKLMEWKVYRAKDIGGCSAIIFSNTVEGHEDLEANGVHFKDTQYGWSDPETDTYKPPKNYIYPMSAGDLKVNLLVHDGLDVNKPFEDEKVLTFLDPFIPVKNILNIPSTIYNGNRFYLSPEIDTGDGVDDQTAIWDDREATYRDMKFTITSGQSIASITDNGVITPKGLGVFKVRVTVPSGEQEEYEWHRLAAEEDSERITFPKIDYVKEFSIQVVAEPPSMKRLVHIMKRNSLGAIEEIDITRKSDFDHLRSIGGPEDSILLNDELVKRSSIVEIHFYDSFDLADLSNFGRNMTGLQKINRIPSSARNLRNFLRGCTSFNQSIAIPKDVTGARCLEGFLRDCTSFNQVIVIPLGVRGEKCLESFLRGCTSFNQRISLPEELSGDCCMYSFMMDCTAFNSPIILPKRISGKRCMENVLRNCQSFNQAITLPEQISGHYNMAAFMFNCNNMISPVVVPTTECAEGSEHDVITLSTFYRNAAIATNGIDVRGPAAKLWADKTGTQPPVESTDEDLLPLRTFKTSDKPAPEPEPIEPHISVSVSKEAVPNGVYNDYLVGDKVDYVITVTNKSETAVTGVKLTDAVPGEVTYVSSSANRENVSVNVTGGKPKRRLTVRGAYPDGTNYTNMEVEVGSTVTLDAGTIPPGEVTTPDGATKLFGRWCTNTHIDGFSYDAKKAKRTFVMPNIDLIITAIFKDTVRTNTISYQDSFADNLNIPFAAETVAGYLKIPVYYGERGGGLRRRSIEFVDLYSGNYISSSSVSWENIYGPNGISDGVIGKTATVSITTKEIEVVTLWEDPSDPGVDIPVPIPPVDEGSSTIQSVEANIGEIGIGEEVKLTVQTTAGKLGAGIQNTASIVFDQSDKQSESSKAENSDTATINIVETLVSR